MYIGKRIGRVNYWRRPFEKIRVEVNPLYFQVYDLLVAKDNKPKEVAKKLSIPTSQVYLAKHRITEALKKAVDEMNQGYS